MLMQREVPGSGGPTTCRREPRVVAQGRGPHMPVLALCAFALEQLIQWRYGAAGAVALGVVTIGHRTRKTALTCLGLVVLALLVAQ